MMTKSWDHAAGLLRAKQIIGVNATQASFALYARSFEANELAKFFKELQVVEFREIQKDLFTMPEEYCLAHCISADARMGAGIAVEFRERFRLSTLQEMAIRRPLEIGKCYRVGRALNLVTKAKYWHKPSYESLTQALESMKGLCLQEGITKVAMPRIGCGLDRLQWGIVREIILEVFEDTDLEIVICVL